MKQAIQVAASNRNAPFGAVLVDRIENSIVSQGVNQSHLNPIVHGEIDAIFNYAESRRDRWSELTLYSTAEPCCMCQAAILWAGIPEVVYGTSIATLKSLGWNQFDLTAQSVTNSAAFTDCKISGGVLASACDELFRNAKR